MLLSLQSNPLKSLLLHTSGFCFRKPNYSKAWRSKKTIFPEIYAHGKNFVIFAQRRLILDRYNIHNHQNRHGYSQNPEDAGLLEDFIERNNFSRPKCKKSYNFSTNCNITIEHTFFVKRKNMLNAKKTVKYLHLADMQTIFALSLPMVGNLQRFRTLSQFNQRPFLFYPFYHRGLCSILSIELLAT